MQVYGNLAYRESVVHLDKIQLETKRGVKYTSWIQMFLHSGVHEHGGKG